MIWALSRKRVLCSGIGLNGHKLEEAQAQVLNILGKLRRLTEFLNSVKSGSFNSPGKL